MQTLGTHNSKVIQLKQGKPISIVRRAQTDLHVLRVQEILTKQEMARIRSQDRPIHEKNPEIEVSRQRIEANSRRAHPSRGVYGIRGIQETPQDECTLIVIVVVSP
jgi:hypothetical protein